MKTMIKFGTDGVRGVANTELSPELSVKLGKAGAFVLGSGKKSPNILVGKDTRISSDMLECALVAGICSVGANAHIAGVLPTPGIAALVKKYGLDGGVIISASHNPVQDNGIKFINADGYKLDDSFEAKIEDIINNNHELQSPTGANVGSCKFIKSAASEYCDFLKSTMESVSLNGLKVGLDCANGATYHIAPDVIKTLGASVYTINTEPNGININQNCGSTNMSDLSHFVIKNKLDIGLAFDGDGDRCLAVDAFGKQLNGDEIMSVCANYLYENKRLNKNTMVTTVMSNIGLKKMAIQNKINLIQTNVGDRHVLDSMIKNGYNFGGEQSGHIIFLDYNTTGDGILSALQLLKIMAVKKLPLHTLNTLMITYPQILVNAYVKSKHKNSFINNPKVAQAIEQAQAQFNDNGRVYIRPSGTEPFIRIMIEGPEITGIEEAAYRIKNIIEKELI